MTAPDSASETPERSALQATIMRTLDWGYDAALNGLPGLDSATEMAESYMKSRGTRWEQAGSLIRWQVAKSSTAGFVAGLGGLLTLPVTIPANIASVAYVQLRMTAALAHMGGFDVKDDRVRTLCYACLTGKAASDVLKDFGMRLGTKLSEQGVRRISGETVKSINKAVGFRLITKFGSTGLVNVGKLIPVVGGLVNAGFDGTSTRIVGGVARRAFIGKDEGPQPSAPSPEPDGGPSDSGEGAPAQASSDNQG